MSSFQHNMKLWGYDVIEVVMVVLAPKFKCVYKFIGGFDVSIEKLVKLMMRGEKYFIPDMLLLH